MKKGARQATDRMICGKLRRKAKRGGATASIVTVDDVDYAWAYRHGWVVWGKGIEAISISVSLNPGRTRELILDFAVKVNDEDGTPSDARVLRALQSAVRSARDAGWDPESRGRAFRYEIAATAGPVGVGPGRGRP